MKKLLSVIAAIALVACVAQAKGNENLVTTVLKADVTCQNCADKIMNNVPSLGKGIKDVNVDVENKLVMVTYNKSKNNVGNLIKGLASLNVAASESNTSATLAKAGACGKKAKCKKAAAGCCKGGKAAKEKKDCCKSKDKKVANKKCAGSLDGCKAADANCSKAKMSACAKAACAKADASCSKAKVKKECKKKCKND